MSAVKRIGWTAAAIVVGIGSAVLTLGGAGAQNGKPAASPKSATQAQPAPAPVSSDPGSTSASYGDWLLRCQRVGEAEKAQRICEVAQTIQVQGQQGPLAQIAFGKVQASDPLKLTVALPANITLPSSVTIASNDKDPPIVELTWRRCIPGACVADAVPSADALKQFRSVTEPGRLTFKDAAGRDIAVPLSLRGLPQALDALAKSS